MLIGPKHRAIEDAMDRYAGPKAGGAMPPLRYAPGAIDVTLLQRDSKLARKSLRRSLTQGMAPSHQRVAKHAATFSEELHGLHSTILCRRAVRLAQLYPHLRNVGTSPNNVPIATLRLICA